MSAIIQNIKDSVMELRGVVNHHYKDKDEAYANQASIFKINYKIWNAVYKFIWTREISSYNDLLNTIKSDAEINSVNWKRMYTILLIVCVYSLLRSRILKNYEKTKVKQMVDTNKEGGDLGVWPWRLESPVVDDNIRLLTMRPSGI